MKKYLIRVVKYIAYFCILFAIIYALMYTFNVVPPSTSHLLNKRLAIGLVLLGLFYPLIGFKKVTFSLPAGSREAHQEKICGIIKSMDYRIEKSEGETITFVAVSLVRRALAMFEERITLEFQNNGNSITLSGLRKDIARTQLLISDYLRRNGEQEQ